MRARRPLAAKVALAAVVALSGGGLSACGEDEDDNAEAPSLEAESIPDLRGPDDLTDPYVGILDEAFRNDLEAYAGQEVTVLAEVDEVISPRAFTVTSPEDDDVDPVLVVAADGAGDVAPEAGQQLYLAATPQEDLDAAALLEEQGLDIDAEQLADWEDDTFLLTTVLQAAD